jgi:hypothetical protein
VGKYLIASDRVLFVHEKEEGCVSWEDFASPDFIKEAPASVLLTEIEFKKNVPVVNGDAQKSTDPAGLFPANMTVQEELLKNGTRQCAGVRSGRLHEVLGVFPRGSVRVCVPYALSIRAFLIASGLFEEKAVRVVVEEAGERSFLTIFDGMEVVVARALSGLSLREVSEELSRSLKRSDVVTDEQTKFIVNNQEIGEMLVAEDVCTATQTIVTETTRMAFGALDRTTFKMNFLLPEEIARKQRKEWRRRSVVAYAGAGCVVVLAMLYAAGGAHIKKEALMKEQQALTEMSAAERSLKEKSANVFRAVLGERPVLEYERIFQALSINTPRGWRLETVDIREQGALKTVIEATFSGTQDGAFMCEGLFRVCHVRSFFVSGKLWSVVNAEVYQQGEK